MATIEDHDGTPVLSHEVGGYRYSFCVREFPVSHYPWLCDVIGSHMNQIHERATKQADFIAKQRIKDALGIKG